ncbi:peptide chain release factor N(5)-glutamine methyltransferase [Suttonella sp. R2A3]|uniref:peptide chain release factor N(5)-glutamine methyltransferase n=1 Tax=Suttonella sp. R2A3 TaxID=2908648 RepID=UPI001F28A4C0|nr:peptide chain release factor N(5)-glutamine methyltransferase [Suttonella sp. R2A3]UJF23934.1 peptide chain release factor N(5)-glutamine methyltransferase [Suttonella sp. R2A3]
MTLNQWLIAACGKIDSDEAMVEARWLLAYVTGLNPTQQRIHDPELSTSQQQHLNQLLARRLNGEPLAYLVEHQPFYTLDLAVNQHTLIPRADSECLLETTLGCLKGCPTPLVADLGTGSGALALAVAQTRPDAQVIASDRSLEALRVANINAVRHQITNVAFILGDWLEPLADSAFDVIMSNPPYIADDDPHLTSLSYEPYSALVAAEQGYADLKHLIDHAARALKPGGWLLLEHGFEQAAKLRELAQNRALWQQISTVQDHGGRDRVTLMQRS